MNNVFPKKKKKKTKLETSCFSFPKGGQFKGGQRGGGGTFSRGRVGMQKNADVLSLTKFKGKLKSANASPFVHRRTQALDSKKNAENFLQSTLLFVALAEKKSSF